MYSGLSKISKQKNTLKDEEEEIKPYMVELQCTAVGPWAPPSIFAVTELIFDAQNNTGSIKTKQFTEIVQKNSIY